MPGSSTKLRQAAPPMVLATLVANASSTLPKMFSTTPVADGHEQLILHIRHLDNSN